MKTTIEIKIADLNTNRARVIDDPSRGALAATLRLTSRDGKSSESFHCTRTYAKGLALEFSTYSYVDSAALIDLLTFNLINFEVERAQGKLIRVSVLELLDKGWTLVRDSQDRLRCVAPPYQGVSLNKSLVLSFVNDGTNFWAEFDGTTRLGADLVQSLLDNLNTKYEVLE